MANKICESCATEYDDMLPKCPYCGSTNYKGAEAEYLKKLEDVRDDMEDLEEVPEQETKKAFRKQARFLLILLFIIGIIGVLIIGFVVWQEHQYKRDEKADFLWRQQKVPILNRLYEEGEYDELFQMLLEEGQEGAPVWTWEHSDFYELYGTIESVESLLSREEAGENIDDYYAGIFFDQWQIIGIPMSELDEQEKAILEEYGKPVVKDFRERWNLSEEEYNVFYRELEENRGWVDYESCKNYVKKWYKEKQKGTVNR